VGLNVLESFARKILGSRAAATTKELLDLHVHCSRQFLIATRAPRHAFSLLRCFLPWQSDESLASNTFVGFPHSKFSAITLSHVKKISGVVFTRQA
jgi:hypothetical protein